MDEIKVKGRGRSVKLSIVGVVLLSSVISVCMILGRTKQVDLEKRKEMAKSVILWLHGLGDSGPANMPIKKLFSAPQFANTKWLFPSAPSQRVTCNYGATMPAWFDLYEMPVTAESPRDEEGVMTSVAKVHEMIDNEVATGISPKNIFVCGFSQGGALTLASAMLYAVFSGWVPFNSSFAEKISSEAKQTRVLWSHGMNDNIVEFRAAQAGPPLLERAGVNCQFKAYPGLGHSISSEELTSLESWIKSYLLSSSS